LHPKKFVPEESKWNIVRFSPRVKNDSADVVLSASELRSIKLQDEEWERLKTVSEFRKKHKELDKI
jgi:hypothetical protein